MYVIGDRLVMQAAASPHPAFNTDRIQYRIVSRCDGQIWVQSPVTPKNASATVSPVVRLV